MKALVIGFGSIGSRHAGILRRLGCDVGVVTRRIPEDFTSFAELAVALEKHKPAYVVIANATNMHYQTLQRLIDCGFSGRVLVEKPLFAEDRPVPANRFQSLHVGYNLRFHPLLVRVREIIATEVVLSVDVRVGQYLPTWRRADYRDCYSARRAAGGGVLNDLSHELDYVQWLFGRWRRLAAIGGKVSDLEIDSDDLFALLVVTDRCPVASLQMDYLHRGGRREMTIQTNEDTIRADLLNGVLEIGGISERDASPRDETYLRQHEAVVTGRRNEFLCSAGEAMETVRMIHATETAARDHRWIEN